MGEQLFLNFEQIIPTQDAEDYMIGMAEKAQDDVESKTVTDPDKNFGPYYCH